MTPTSTLPAPGQSPWRESFTGELLINGTLQCIIDEDKFDSGTRWPSFTTQGGGR
jgi:hypothetical protein